MIRFNTWLLFTLWLLGTSNATLGRDIYVNNVAGDDRANGRESEPGHGMSGPVRTLAKALRICGKADRIVLANAGQPYHESLSLSAGKHWGFPSQPFTIVGNGTILDGTRPVNPRAWEFVGRDVFSFQPTSLAYQQLYLAGKPAARRLFAIPDSTPLALQPLEWMLHEGNLFFRPEKNMLPEDYDLSYMALQTGITLYHVRNVRIENLVVQGFRQDGINLHDGCNNCVLVNVTSRGNGRSGISVGGSSRAIIEQAITVGRRFARKVFVSLKLLIQRSSPTPLPNSASKVAGFM